MTYDHKRNVAERINSAIPEEAEDFFFQVACFLIRWRLARERKFSSNEVK